MSYTAILSYLFLSGSAFWALSQCDGDFCQEFWCCSNVGFGLICINGFLGLWYCSRQAGPMSSVMKAYRKHRFVSVLSFSTYIFCVPLIIVDLYLYYMFSAKVAYVHLIYPCLAFLPKIFGCEKKESVQMVDMVILLSVGSLTTTCAMRHNYYGLAAGITLALSHFFISAERRTFGMDSRTVQNYLMCVFLVLSFRALVDAEKSWLINCAQAKDVLSLC